MSAVDSGERCCSVEVLRVQLWHGRPLPNKAIQHIGQGMSSPDVPIVDTVQLYFSAGIRPRAEDTINIGAKFFIFG
jgi:hypothetical protein